MGCGCSSSKKALHTVHPERGFEAAELWVGSYPIVQYKDSRLFAPTNHNATGPVPAVVIVHGMCGETEFKGDLAFRFGFGLRGLRSDWQQMQYVAREIAKQGVVVLMIGMPDNDKEVCGAKFPNLSKEQKKCMELQGILNMWPACFYSKALNAAIDHVCIAAPEHLGLEIDQARIGLVGHSMGGAGVLYAAGVDCKDRVKAVASLNPGYLSVFEPFDVQGMGSDSLIKSNTAQYLQTKDKSLDVEGKVSARVAHLASISAATLILGSQAEIEDPKVSTPEQPKFVDLFEEVGSFEKELFVDNIKSSFAIAHTWHAHENPDEMRKYAGGITLETLLSFVRRKLVGSAEERMPKPDVAHDWKEGSVPK